MSVMPLRIDRVGSSSHFVWRQVNQKWIGNRFFSISSIRQNDDDKSPFKVLFCGTDDFALECLIRLHKDPKICNHIQVLTPPDAPNRWKRSKKIITVSPVKSFAIENNLVQHTIPESGLKDFEIPKEFTKEAKDSLLLTVSFGHLIPSKILQHFLWSRRLNVHPSLLPALKGAAPIQWAIARNLTRTGVSIQTLGEKFDSGEVLNWIESSIPERATYISLREKLKPIAAEQLMDTLSNLQHYANLVEKKKDDQTTKTEIVPSFAPMIQSKMTIVRWNSWNANKIDARHRSMGYLFPLKTETLTRTGDRITVLLKDVDLYDTRQESSSGKVFTEKALEVLNSSEPGTMVHDRESNLVLCKCIRQESESENQFLHVKSIQTVGKKVVPASEWMNGYTESKGAVRTIRFVDAN